MHSRLFDDSGIPGWSVKNKNLIESMLILVTFCWAYLIMPIYVKSVVL